MNGETDIPKARIDRTEPVKRLWEYPLLFIDVYVCDIVFGQN